jgi:hypothetical protein
MIEARYESFLAPATGKKPISRRRRLRARATSTSNSTPAISAFGTSIARIAAAVFVSVRPEFRFNDTYPYQAHYIAPCCGTVIEAHEKNALVRALRRVDRDRAGAGQISELSHRRAVVAVRAVGQDRRALDRRAKRSGQAKGVL